MIVAQAAGLVFRFLGCRVSGGWFPFNESSGDQISSLGGWPFSIPLLRHLEEPPAIESQTTSATSKERQYQAHGPPGYHHLQAAPANPTVRAVLWIEGQKPIDQKR